MDDEVLEGIETKVHKLRSFTSEEEEKELIEFPQIERDNVRLLTYNHFLRGGMIAKKGGEFKEERLKLFAGKFMDQFDIMCFQEIFEGWNSRQQKAAGYGIKEGFFDNYYLPIPGFSKRFAASGGISIQSRFPIVEKDHKIYEKFTSNWTFARKGVLYTKIQIANGFLHLFNTHMQANYPTTSFKNMKKWVDCRIYQIHEMAEFIELKTRDAAQEDIILCVGDFNINAREFSEVAKKFYTERALQDDRFKIFIDPKRDPLAEYNLLIKILEWDDQLIVTDVVKESFGGESPATFGTSTTDENGDEEPEETYFTPTHDLCSNQCIDYILSIRRKEYSETPEESTPKHDTLKIDTKSCSVEKFMVTVKDKPYTQLSDHFGLAVNISKAD